MERSTYQDYRQRVSRRVRWHRHGRALVEPGWCQQALNSDSLAHRALSQKVLRTRWRRSLKSTRPFGWRLVVFRLLISPSAGPANYETVSTVTCSGSGVMKMMRSVDGTKGSKRLGLVKDPGMHFAIT